MMDDDVPTIAMGLDFLKRTFEEGNTSAYISPYSLSVALAMCVHGAKGATLRGLLEVMKTKGLDVSRYTNVTDDVRKAAKKNGTFLLSPGLWCDKKFGLTKDFRENCKKYFDGYASTFSDPEELKDSINRYISDGTKDKLQDTISGDIERSAKFVVATGIYYKGIWQDSFDTDRVKSDIFTTLSGEKKQADYLYLKRREFEYLDEDSFQAVNVPYRNRFVATIVLPKKKTAMGLTDVLQTLATSYDKIMPRLSKDSGELYLPKFKIDYKSEISKTLGKMGMDIAFSPLSDFSNMTNTPEGLALNRFFQHTVIEIGDEGVNPPSDESSDRERSPVGFFMKVDSPFILLIRDVRSNILLFAGVVNDFQEKFESTKISVSPPRKSKSPSSSSSKSRRRSRSRSRSREKKRSRSPRRSRSRDRKRRSRSRSRSPSYRRSRSRDRKRRSRSRSPPRRHRRSYSPRYRTPSPPYAVRLGAAEERRKTTSIYVGNLPGSFSSGQIQDLFGQAGKLEVTTFRVNKQGSGYAFVQFVDRKDAEEAFDRFRGHQIDGRTITLDWDVGLENKRKQRYPPSYHGRYRSRSRSPGKRSRY